MSAILDFLEGLMVTTDQLIEAFDEAATCDTPDCAAGAIHTLAGEIAQHLREYRDWAETTTPVDLETIRQRKEELMVEMRAFGNKVDALASERLPSFTVVPN